MGELGGAATLDSEPPNLRLRSATRPLTLLTWPLVLPAPFVLVTPPAAAGAVFCCTGGSSDNLRPTGVAFDAGGQLAVVMGLTDAEWTNGPSGDGEGAVLVTTGLLGQVPDRV